MRLLNAFSVDAPPAQAWSVLSDVETVVTCVPGAEVVSREGEDYDGRVTVKVGPVAMRLAGVVRVQERDEAARRLRFSGRAKDLRGQGGVTADVTIQLRPGARGGTDVDVITDLDLSGPAGQLGTPLVRQVNRRLMGEFTARLRPLLEGGTVDRSGAGMPQRAAETVSRQGWAREVLPVVVGGVLLGMALTRAGRSR